MQLLIWGISNIGKTTIGRELSKRLNCKFYEVNQHDKDNRYTFTNRLLI